MVTLNNIAPLILTGLFAVTVLISAIIGLIRGLNKSVIRIMFLVVAAALTFLIAGPVTNLIIDNISVNGMTVKEMMLDIMANEDSLGTILDTMPVIQDIILVLPAFALSIVVFPVVFLLLRFFTWIIFLFVQKPLRKLILKDNCNKEEYAAQSTAVRVGKRFAGMGVGAVSGVLIFGMLFTPLFGVFSTLPSSNAVSDTMQILVDMETISDSDAKTIQGLYSVTDCGLVKFYSAVGTSAAGSAYINSVSTVKSEGISIRLMDEIRTLMTTLQSLGESGIMNTLMNAKDPSELFAVLSDKALVDSLLQDALQARFLAAVVPDLMATAMESIADTMNVPANKDVVYDNMMDAIALAIQNNNVNFEAMLAYEKATNTPAAFVRLSSTTRTGDEGVMTEEEYKAEVEKLTKLATTISGILNRSLSGDCAAFADSVADHIVNDVKNQASENGQAAVSGYDVSALQNTLSGLNAADINAGENDANKLLEQLTNKDTFETDLPTAETIKSAVSDSIRAALADEDKAAETASALASVISDLSDVVSSAVDSDGELDITKIDFNKIASAVNTLQNSPLKETGSSLLDIVISGNVGSGNVVGDLMSAVKDGYDKGEDIGGTIGTAGALIGMGSAMGGEGEEGKQAMANSLTSLINNLNEFTITLLPTILSPDALNDMGIPSEYAKAASGAIETLLRELMKLKGNGSYEAETNAVLSLYNMFTSGAGNFTDEDICNLVSYAVESDAIFNTLLELSAHPLNIEIEDADRAALADAIEREFSESGQSQREREIYLAVAKLLGIGDDVNLGTPA